MSNKILQIGDKTISDNERPFIIAEAGVHHYNSVELAKTYILEAAVAGADAIKFQTYKADRIATVWAPTYWDDFSGRTQHDIFSHRSNLTRDDYQVLFQYASEVGIMLLSTPFDPDAASLLAEFDMSAYKIASADLTHYPLLEKVASFGKPILLSTGAATYEEVEQTVVFLNKLQAQFALLHCVLSYPTRIKDANLRRIAQLRAKFSANVIGYSDHTQPQDSILACPLSVVYGARIIEKHFTLNKLLDGDDHYHAVDANGLKQLVRDCHDAMIMTKPAEEVLDSELPARMYARRSIVAAKTLLVGTIITEADVDFKRPGTGLPPAKLTQILGQKLIKPLNSDDLIKLEDLTDNNKSE